MHMLELMTLYTPYWFDQRITGLVLNKNQARLKRRNNVLIKNMSIKKKNVLNI